MTADMFMCYARIFQQHSRFLRKVVRLEHCFCLGVFNFSPGLIAPRSIATK